MEAERAGGRAGARAQAHVQRGKRNRCADGASRRGGGHLWVRRARQRVYRWCGKRRLTPSSLLHHHQSSPSSSLSSTPPDPTTQQPLPSSSHQLLPLPPAHPPRHLSLSLPHHPFPPPPDVALPPTWSCDGRLSRSPLFRHRHFLPPPPNKAPCMPPSRSSAARRPAALAATGRPRRLTWPRRRNWRALGHSAGRGAGP